MDDTTSYISRFQTLQFNLSKNTGSTGLAFTLTPSLSATTLLSSSTALSYGSGALGTGSVNGVSYTLGSGVPTLNALDHTNYFTGRSDNFNPNLPSTNPNNGRLDPEAIRVSNDGKSVFVSDEYGPYIYQFDRATGQRIDSFALPANLAVRNLSAQGALAAKGITGRVANKGMEGLAITPDGKGLCDGSTAVAKKLFKIDLNGAQDVTNLSGDLSSKAVSKTLFLDVVGALALVARRKRV